MTKTVRTEQDAWWKALKQDVAASAEKEPMLAVFFDRNILRHETFAEALAAILAGKLAMDDAAYGLGRDELARSFFDFYQANPRLIELAKGDLQAVMDRDPAADKTPHIPLLYFKGFHALQTHRLAHEAWTNKRRDIARFLQSQSSERFQVDIHPAARIGEDVMIDHGTGVVIGETAKVGNNVSMLHGVTLGGTGKGGEDRHPKIRDGVLLGAGSKVLGNVQVGENSRVGAGAVVTRDMPAGKSLVGIPARVVGDAIRSGDPEPGKDMNQTVTGDAEIQTVGDKASDPHEKPGVPQEQSGKSPSQGRAHG